VSLGRKTLFANCQVYCSHVAVTCQRWNLCQNIGRYC